MADETGETFRSEERGGCRPAWESLMPSWTCIHCGLVSYHPMNVEYRYCGACHHFCDDVSEVTS